MPGSRRKWLVCARSSSPATSCTAALLDSLYSGVGLLTLFGQGAVTLVCYLVVTGISLHFTGTAARLALAYQVSLR